MDIDAVLAIVSFKEQRQAGTIRVLIPEVQFPEWEKSEQEAEPNGNLLRLFKEIRKNQSRTYTLL